MLNEDKAVPVIGYVETRKPILSGFTLLRGEFESSLRVSFDNEADASIAKKAFPIEENDPIHINAP